MTKVAVLDDYQGIAKDMADWSGLDVTFFRDPIGDTARVIERLQPFDIVCPMRERTQINADVINGLPNLKLLATTGMRNAAIDIPAAKARDVTVCGTRGSATPTPELAFALMLSLGRQIPQSGAAMRQGRWQIGLGKAMRGATLGLLGLGRLGAEVAEYAKVFGMRIIAWSQNLTAERAAECGVEFVTKDELFQQSDFISVHLVLSERSRGLVGARELGLMKPEAYIVNTSRGPIIDEDALLEALQNKQIGGAGIDVFGVEPLPADHPIRSLDNAVLTPHLGYVTEDTYRIFYGETVECIRAWLDGKPLNVIS